MTQKPIKHIKTPTSKGCTTTPKMTKITIPKKGKKYKNGFNSNFKKKDFSILFKESKKLLIIPPAAGSTGF